MTSHPDAEVLARFREGLLGRRRSARLRAHLAGCSRCASVEAGLAEVSTLLASAPVPAMPGHLTARLEGVLAAETAARQRGEGLAATGAATGAAPDDAGGEPGSRRGLPRRPLTRRAPTRQSLSRKPGPAGAGHRARQWRPVVLAAAAVVTLIVVIGVYGLARLAHGSGTPASSQAAPALRSPAASPMVSAPGTRAVQPGSAAAGSLHVVRSGTDYQPARLTHQVQAMLASPLATKMLPLSPAAANSSATGQLQACVRRATGGAQPSLVDLARYRGRPATIIVQAPAGGKPGQVWVAVPGCPAASPGLITHITFGGTG